MAYFDQCLPKIAAIRDGSGCSFTRASFNVMTLDQFAALGDQENLQSVYARATETKMRGVQEKTIAMLLQGRFRDYGQMVQPIKIPGQQSIVAPYIVKKQPHIVNSGYFQVVGGSNTDPGTTPGFNANFHWVIEVAVTASPWQKPLQKLERYFIPGNTVFVDGLTAASAARSNQYTIIAAYNADSGPNIRAKIVLAPSLTPAAFTALTAPQKTAWQPTGGIVQVGANSVSDFESWCYNGAVDINRNMLLFWIQTSRQAQTVSDEYLKALDAENANEFFKVFNSLPYAEQVKQQQKRFEHEWWTSIFKGQPISEQQTPELWQGLSSAGIPKVYDPDDSNCLLEYKANAVGIEPQLGACSRVVDLAGAALNFDNLTEMLYQLKRHREGTNNGETVDTIPIQTDRYTANRIKALFADYEKKKYGVSLHREYGPGDALEFSKSTGLSVNSYDFDEAGVQLHVVSDPFFADLLAATPNAHKSASRYLWMLDYSDIEVGIAATASKLKVYPKNDIVDDLWKCTIKANEKQRRLESTTWTVAITNPDRHLIVKNFSDDCPVLTVDACEVVAG